jgi:hypothetical protein
VTTSQDDTLQSKLASIKNLGQQTIKQTNNKQTNKQTTDK